MGLAKGDIHYTYLHRYVYINILTIYICIYIYICMRMFIWDYIHILYIYIVLCKCKCSLEKQSVISEAIAQEPPEETEAATHEAQPKQGDVAGPELECVGLAPVHFTSVCIPLFEFI